MTYTVRCGNVLHEGRIYRRGEKVFLNDEMAAGLVRSGIIECTDPKIEEPVEEVSEEIEEPVEEVSEEIEEPVEEVSEEIEEPVEEVSEEIEEPVEEVSEEIEEPVEEVSEEIEEPVEKSTPKTKGKRAKAKVSEDSDLPSVNLKELVEK